MNRKTSNRIKMILVASLSLSFLVFSNGTFLMAAAPDISTGSATNITRTSADLAATINDNGGHIVTSTGFEYGLDTSYGSTQNGNLTYGYDSPFSLFSTPYQIFIDSADSVFVVDSANDSVSKLNSLGAPLFSFGTAGNGDGELSSPIGINVDSLGNIYVADTGNNRIQKFNSSGVYQSQFGTFGSGDGQFDQPYRLDFDSLGNIYVVDNGNARVEKFDSSGVYQSQFGTFGSGDGQFNSPSSIRIDSSDNIYVVDTGNNRIQKFNSAGVFISKFGTAGSSNGEFNVPFDVNFDSLGNIYVVDLGNSRVEKFNSLEVFQYEVTDNIVGNTVSIAFDSTDNLFISSNGSGSVDKFTLSAISASLSGLTCATTYHYRAFATNSDGTSYGNDNSFTTSDCEPPVVETKKATIIAKTSVLLNGLELDDGASPSTVRGFEYGQTNSYGQTVTLPDTSLSISSSQYLSNGGVAIDYQGNVYAVVGGDNAVTISDSSGNFVRKFGWGVETGASQFEICTSGCQGGISGSGNGQFDFTSSGTGAIAVDYSGGVIYVDDINGLQKFDLSGNFIEKIPAISGVKDMLVISGTPTYLYTISSAGGINKYATDGTLISALPGGDTSLALSSDGIIYSIDSANNKIIYTYPSSGVSGTVTLTYPAGFSPGSTMFSIAIDANNNMVFDDVFGQPRIVFATPESPTKYSIVSAITSTQIYDAASFELTGSIKDMSFDLNNRIFLSTVNDGGLIMSPFFFKKIKPLTCGTPYHYRAFATNSDGTTYGADETFTTLACTSSSSGGGGPPPPPVYGCTDPAATNYSSTATADDGSCTYPAGYLGCTDPTADNYNASAVLDDGSCSYGGGPTPVLGCMNPIATNYNSLATADDGSCNLPSGGGGGPTSFNGCTDAFAQNYNSSANVDDGSCTYPTPPGTPPTTPVTPTIITTIINTVSNLPPSVHTAVKILAVTGVAIPLIDLIAERGFLANLVSIPIRLWNLIPTLLGFKRKKRPWGTVFDSVTKQPLDPVYVKLLDNNGNEISTFITDLDGRYGFGVPAGMYMMTANKQSYVFPSEKLKGATHDELYDNLYFGESFETSDEDDIINKNIPMDAINFNWNEFEKAKNKKLMKFYSNAELFWARIGKILFFVGFLSSIALTMIDPIVFNFIILGLYFVIFILSLFGVKPRKSGFIKERATGFPVSFGIVSVFSALLNTEIAHAVVGKTGKYYLLVPKGRYYIKIKKKTGENSYEEIYTSNPFKVRKGYIGKVFRI